MGQVGERDFLGVGTPSERELKIALSTFPQRLIKKVSK